MIPSEEHINNENYQQFLKRKEEIKSRYPDEMWLKPNSKNNYDRDMWLQYLKEIADLMYEKEGFYQNFIWDIIPVHERQAMEARAKANTYGRKDNFNYY